LAAVSEVIRIDDAIAANLDRFARFRLINWWDQELLAKARIVVIGAGALGNEIVKNLALLGAGRVFVADGDKIENSNLSRSILFRDQDCGRPKETVAALGAAEIYPGIRVQPFIGNIVHDLGLGIYRWADVILGRLDNREARVAINHAAARAGKIWIDGAIERLDGVARVFDPATGPCYECTMGENDWRMLEARRSCALLFPRRDGSRQGPDHSHDRVDHRRSPGPGGDLVSARARDHCRPRIHLRRHPPPDLHGRLHVQERLPCARN
jgi:hypothetical protein